MAKRTHTGESAGRVLIRVLACLLLAGSLAMLLLPWVSLRLDDNGERVTLREMAQNAQQRGGLGFRERYLSRLSERDEGLYAGLLRTIDPFLDDSMSPLRTAVSCSGAARWLTSYSTAARQGAGVTDPTLEAWAQGVRNTAERVKLAAVFLWFLMAMLLITGVYAIYSAAAGYGFGMIPYLVCGMPAFLGAVLAVARCNDWYGGQTQSAQLLRAAVEGFSPIGNPVSVPFRLGLGAILFGVLLLLGLLLGMCALKRPGAEKRPAAVYPAPARAGAARPNPAFPRTEPAEPRPAPARAMPNAWRCPACGTLMGDGVYCVKCGGRKPEPRRCAACGEILEEGSVFCASCGQPVEKKRPTQPEAESPATFAPAEQPVPEEMPEQTPVPEEAAQQPPLQNESEEPLDFRIEDDFDL